MSRSYFQDEFLNVESKRVAPKYFEGRVEIVNLKMRETLRLVIASVLKKKI